MLVGLGNEYPHLQSFIRILFPKPNSQTIEICLWHNVSLVFLCQSYVLCDENNQQVSSTELKIFIIAHNRQQLIEASVVVKNGGMCCTFHFQILKRSCYGPWILYLLRFFRIVNGAVLSSCSIHMNRSRHLQCPH